MRRTLAGMLLIGAAAAMAPERAAAQADGWWEWAFGTVVQNRETRAVSTQDPRARIGDQGPAVRTRGAPAGIAGDREHEPEEREDGDEQGEEGPGGPPFCRNGTGHPVHGMQWCREREFGQGGVGRGGPAFCRSGIGHPVHGRAWCGEKGFSLGAGTPGREAGWDERGGWDDVSFPVEDRERRVRSPDERSLRGLLGDNAYRRLQDEKRQLGGQEPLSGRWIRPSGPAEVLQIRSGAIPVAELSDLDGDGRVDAVIVPRR